MELSPENLKARWDELTAVREGYDAKLNPLREELASIVQGTFDGTLAEAQVREAEVRAEILKLQNELFPIENERGAIARALGGKTG